MRIRSPVRFKVYVDHANDGQNDTMSCIQGAPHLVLTSKEGRTKLNRKTRTSVHALNGRERQPMKRCQKIRRHEREQSGSTGRVDRSINAHTAVKYHKMELEEQTRREERTEQRESNTRCTMTTRNSQSG